MNETETLTLSPGDEELIIADMLRKPEPLTADSWANAIIADPFMVSGVDSPIPF